MAGGDRTELVTLFPLPQLWSGRQRAVLSCWASGVGSWLLHEVDVVRDRRTEAAVHIAMFFARFAQNVR
jgi:hypothetical protein